MSKKHLTKKQIVHRVKQLYKKGEPLNISAVKRNHPQLIASAFSGVPVLGWRRCIEVAGINYGHINVEILDSLICEICGKSFKNLANHLRMKHQVSADEYRIDYPGAEMLCETERVQRCDFKSQKVIPHWEPLWTPEYVLDRLHHFHTLGVVMTLSSINSIDNGLGNAIMDWKGELGGGWEHLMTRIGVEIETGKVNGQDHLPSALRRKFRKVKGTGRYPTGKDVVAKIQARDADGRSISSLGVQRGEESDPTLFTAARRYFGTWDEALRQADIDPETIHYVFPRKHPDKKAVIEGILERKRRDLPLNHAALVRGEYTDMALYYCAVEYFLSWDAALESAGLNPLDYRVVKAAFNTPEKTIAEIKARIARGEPMNHGAVNLECPSLEGAMYNHFGNWDNALLAAGIDPDSVRIRPRFPYKNEWDVIRGILEQYHSGQSLLATHVKSPKHPDYKYGLLASARKFCGTWSEALRQAGINPKQVLREARLKRKKTTRET